MLYRWGQVWTLRRWQRSCPFPPPPVHMSAERLSTLPWIGQAIDAMELRSFVPSKTLLYYYLLLRRVMKRI